MPRKRRPSPPAPGSLPLRQIAPKPETNISLEDPGTISPENQAQSNSELSSVGSDEANVCGVPQCKLVNCNLATHRNYTRQRRLAFLQSSASGSSRRSSTAETEQDSANMPQLPSGDRFRLPIEDNPNQDFHRLLQQFFVQHYDRLTLVYRPQRLDPAFKRNLQRMALQNGTYCLTLVALSHLANVKDGPSKPEPEIDRLTDQIYSHLVQVTREKIDSLEMAEIDVLLLAITTLCKYDMMLDRHEALLTHHKGLVALVASRGGIHNLGLSLPYVVSIDRLLAIRSCDLPQYTTLDSGGLEFAARQASTSTRFGSYFSDANQVPLSEAISSLCLDAVHLLTVMDELKMNFDPLRQGEVVGFKLEYFRFLREDIDNRHAVLNHQLSASSGSGHKDLLALTAMRIVTYYLAMDNYLTFVTDSWATRLWNALMKVSTNTTQEETTNLDRRAGVSSPMPTIKFSDWAEDMPLLLWLLFACALPGARERNLSFTARLELESPLARGSSSSKLQSKENASRFQGNSAIVSPSSPRRHRFLPGFILHVAEHLIGERPLSGTGDWDAEISRILDSFVWSNERLIPEFRRIIGRVHEHVLMRAEEAG